jgi:drug/metabolite transporter (DMT)-like permease
MKISLLFIVLLGLNFILSTAGDTAAKLWAINPGQKWLLITIAINVFTTISFMLVIRQSGLAVGSTIMLLLTMVSTFLIGYLIFKEQITSGQWVGIALGFCAVLFLLNVIQIPN